MEILPFHVQEQLFKHLSVPEVVLISSICKKWRELVNEGELSEWFWHDASDRNFGCKKTTNGTWRLFVKENTRQFYKFKANKSLLMWSIKNGHDVIFRVLWQPGNWYNMYRKVYKVIEEALKLQHFDMIAALNLTPAQCYEVLVYSKLKKAPLPMYLPIFKMAEYKEFNFPNLVIAAMVAKNVPVVQYLLGNVTKNILEFRTIMQSAVSSNNIDILNEIKATYKRLGGDELWQEVLYFKDYHFASLFIFAGSLRCEVSVAFLLENGANINEIFYGEKAIHICCRNPTGIIPTINILLDHGASLNELCFNVYKLEEKSFSSCLHRAVRSDNIELVQHLVSKGADINIGDQDYPGLYSVVFDAISSKMINLLLDLGLNPLTLSPNNKTILQHFIERASPSETRKNVISLFERLRAAGVDPNHNLLGCTKTETGIPTYVLKWLVVHAKMDVNQTNEDGNTPLIVLCRDSADWRGGSGVSYLIHKGADVNAKNKYGETALFHAASKKCSGFGRTPHFPSVVVPLLLNADAKEKTNE